MIRFTAVLVALLFALASGLPATAKDKTQVFVKMPEATYKTGKLTAGMLKYIDTIAKVTEGLRGDQGATAYVSEWACREDYCWCVGDLDCDRLARSGVCGWRMGDGDWLCGPLSTGRIGCSCMPIASNVRMPGDEPIEFIWP